MGPRVSTRPRFPEHSRPLRVIRTYEEYAQLEASFSDFTHLAENGDAISKRAGELKYEASRTLDILKQKQPVRIPETKAAEESSTADTASAKGTGEGKRLGRAA